MCILLKEKNIYYAIQSLNEQHISYEIKQKFAFHLQMETGKSNTNIQTRTHTHMSWLKDKRKY